jgi:AbrB family transcriptional regulator (stage V sporulation protein T)
MKKKVPQMFGEVCGTTIVGSRGQVVVPKEARHKLNLKPGDQFLVIEHFGKLILIPEKIMRQMVEQVTKHLK